MKRIIANPTNGSNLNNSLSKILGHLEKFISLENDGEDSLA